MGPACANVGSYPPMRPPKPMECADKPSWTGDGQVCFPCIGPMTMGWLSLNRPMNMLFRRMLTNIKGHAKRAQGVQYATKSFVCGVYALQTRGAMPMEAMKSENTGFHLGTLPSISKMTLFIRSVNAALGSPPKYSQASMKQRSNVGVSQRLTKVTKRMRE